MTDEIVVIGVSHRTAPLDLRERLAVPPERVEEDLKHLLQTGTMSESLVISTCNRVEVYAAAHDRAPAVRAVEMLLDEHAKPSHVASHLYERSGEEAVLHAFRVASSLDSMVLGEPQILGQVKQAFTIAEATGSLGPLLSRCFTKAFSVAKRVRSETGIAAGTVSVSSIACELAKTVFGDLIGRRVLLVGAGKMSESAAKYLRKQGAKLVVVNRSEGRAQELANLYDAEARKIEELENELVLADIVISSTSSTTFVITKQLMQRVVKARRRRHMLLIDIAVPRDIDPQVGSLDNVVLYDIDDLQKVAEENLSERRKQAANAENIVLTEAREFEMWRRTRDLAPTIAALRGAFQDVVLQEIERTLPRLQTNDREALDRMGEALVNKLLHHAINELKRGADTPDGAELVRTTQRLFALDARLKEKKEKT